MAEKVTLPTPATQLRRVAGGYLLRTGAIAINFVNTQKTQSVQVYSGADATVRSFYIRGEGYVSIPSGVDYELLQVDQNTDYFKFIKL